MNQTRRELLALLIAIAIHGGLAAAIIYAPKNPTEPRSPTPILTPAQMTELQFTDIDPIAQAKAAEQARLEAERQAQLEQQRREQAQQEADRQAKLEQEQREKARITQEKEAQQKAAERAKKIAEAKKRAEEKRIAEAKEAQQREKEKRLAQQREQKRREAQAQRERAQAEKHRLAEQQKQQAAQLAAERERQAALARQQALAVQAQKNAQQTARNNGSQQQGKSDPLIRYKRELSAYIQRYIKHRRLRGNGRVEIGFTILANGQFSNIYISKSSGNPSVDQSARNLVQNVARFNPPPNRQTLSIIVPIKTD
ncbi:cell envelope integrity protein TolA [Suttonella ornithocola]|uniref:Protein TolA n=1 Tax=Suttonella ornithocola TaxID=279832 RepID=A0A380MLX6_9GAMM|nr:cell envelope integrity protein TolA [Suttonella ornithocola]SUO93184.1 protein TolA [Suttonella ornithocola]